MEKENGNTIKYRVEQLEACNRELDGKVEKILTNHLPHIQASILTTKAEIKDDINDLKLVVKENTVKVAFVVSTLMTIASVIINKLL